MRAAAAVLATAVAACGSSDPLSSDAQIAGWANAASALGVFTRGYDPLAFADGELVFDDDSCPVTSDDGTMASIEGEGCTDSEGVTHFGTATIVRTPDAGRVVDMAGFGRSDDPDFVSTVTGRFDVEQLDIDLHSFDVEVTQRGGLETVISYTGTVAGGYDGPTVWNGSGTVSRRGAAVDNGTVQAQTRDQLRDNEICSGQGVSGTTTLRSPEHEVVVTYDGDVDCDEDDAARWGRDGVDQGLVAGVSCAVGGGPTGFAPLFLMLIFVWARPR